MTASETSAFDEGRVAERLALAARACGLGSCIATLKEQGPDEALLFGIGGKHEVGAGDRDKA